LCQGTTQSRLGEHRGDSHPQPPRAATYLVRETQTARADTNRWARLRGFSMCRPPWEVACGDAHARLDSGGWSDGARGRNRGVDTGLRGSLLCRCAVRGAEPAGGECETHTRGSRAAVGANGSRGRNRGGDTGLHGSLLCRCTVRGAGPAGGKCETRTRESRVAVGV